MKLICLNIWGGKVYEPLMKFIKEQSATTDIFCFQEAFSSEGKNLEIEVDGRANIFEELVAALPDFNYVFHKDENIFGDPQESGSWPVRGQAEFVRKSFPIISSGEVKIYEGKDESSLKKYSFLPRSFGYFRTSRNGKPLTVVNIHALTDMPDDKLDNPERLIQSAAVKNFALAENCDVIICGDFNVLPHTASITIFSDSFADLVKDFKILTTRSVISPWHGTPNEMTYSDYVFTSPDIEITGFSVPDPELSDHLPIIVEFR